MQANGGVFMERVYDVAQFIFDEYKRVFKQIIDETKLHKLLYFTQRESFAINGEPMFNAELEGWVFGPVCEPVRSTFSKSGLSVECNDVSRNSAYIIKNVISQYGAFSSSKLSKISHNETSWINSRCGLGENDIGNIPLKLTDIKKDAEKIRPYDHNWDMYYDEFDDAEQVN
jgi:uncharacterized phage-associated protein